ncbi:MAG: hypothetical protein H6988_09175 [Pseudomonadales bacterium]|nr:hypothetical protein [Pseudomonadales bacterium]
MGLCGWKELLLDLAVNAQVFNGIVASLVWLVHLQADSLSVEGGESSMVSTPPLPLLVV